jgi:ribokinase
MARHVVCVGAAVLDTIYRLAELPAGPGKYLAQAAVEVAEGMASSAAAAIVRLGGRATLLARVGGDLAGERIIADLTAAGIDTEHVRRIAGAASPRSTILVDAQGERIVVPWYDPQLGSDASWLPAERVAAADAVLADVRWPAASLRALRWAREGGRPAVLDADVAPAEVIDELIGSCSHAVFAAQALTAFTGREDPAAALQLLAARTGSVLGVTLGPGGCLWLDPQNGIIERVRALPVEAVDTLAAGDVWHGAFTLALAEGRPLRAAMAFASIAASLKCRRFGGRLGAPGRAEVEGLMAAGELE